MSLIIGILKSRGHQSFKAMVTKGLHNFGWTLISKQWYSELSRISYSKIPNNASKKGYGIHSVDGAMRQRVHPRPSLPESIATTWM